MDPIWEQSARALGWCFDKECGGWVKFGMSGPAQLNFTLVPLAQDACAVEGIMTIEEAQVVIFNLS